MSKFATPATKLDRPVTVVTFVSVDKLLTRFNIILGAVKNCEYTAILISATVELLAVPTNVEAD